LRQGPAGDAEIPDGLDGSPPRATPYKILGFIDSAGEYLRVADSREEIPAITAYNLSRPSE
jgi:hypothetical protein